MVWIPPTRLSPSSYYDPCFYLDTSLISIVLQQGYHKQEIQIRRNAPLRQLMRAYVNLKRLSGWLNEEYKFFFEGKEIIGWETADKLELKNRDLIDVHIVGGGG